MINFRYVVKDVIVGRVLTLDKDGVKNDGLIAVGKPTARLCVVDRIKEEAIDVMDLGKKYPFIGEGDGNFIVRKEPIDDNKEYALMMEDSTCSPKTKKLLIKDLKKRGII